MRHSIHHLTLKSLTPSQGTCPALWFAIEMNYSGSVTTDYNIGSSDGDATTNYYILDNLNNLSSITVYDVDDSFNKNAIFSLEFRITLDPNSSHQTLVLVGGTSQTININNGTQNTINDGINTNTVDNRQGIFVEGESSSLNNSPKSASATKDAMNSLTGSGSGGGGGGCLLK